MSQYMHQDAKLWDAVKIGRSKYRAIGRDLRGVMLWKGSGPTIYVLIEKAQGEFGTGRFDDAPFAQPIAQQFSRMSMDIKRHIRAQQKAGVAASGGQVRRNVFAFNNSGKTIRCKCGETLELHGDTECPKCGQWYNAFGQRLKPPSDWTENPGARRNIFAFNNEGGPEQNADFAWPNSHADARENVFAFNNPGKEQVWLAEQFVKGANSGVAGSIYIHGPTIYSYGPHFPIARREGDLILITTKHSPSRTTSGHIGLIKRAAQEAGKEVAYQELAPEASGPAGFSNPLTRRESGEELRFARGRMQMAMDQQRAGMSPDYDLGHAHGIAGVVGRRGIKVAQKTAERVIRHIRYNPAGESRGVLALDKFAKSLGLHIETWAPGDGVTRYRFFTKPTDYHGGDGIYTALGLKEAWCFVRGYAASKTGTRGNPASADAQSFISGKVGILVREGYPQKQAVAIAYSMARKAGYRVPARANCCSNLPTCDNPLTVAESREISVDAVNDAHRARGFRGERRGFYVGRSAMAQDVIRRYGPEFVRSNPLLQTVMLANPPIDRKWPSLTRRQRHAALEFAGFPDDYAWALAAAPSWAGLTDSARNALMRSWQENNPARRGTAARHTAQRSGGARPRARVTTTTTKQERRVVGNPGPIRIPFREGQKIPIERARAWVRKLGNPELLRQFEEAERLQTKANKRPRFVIWKTLPIGSTKKIEMLTSFAHYGDSPETMYKPPKGSKKGRHMYRHEWGDGSGRPRPVPVLAAPGGKVIVKVMGPGQKTGDWMRG